MVHFPSPSDSPDADSVWAHAELRDEHDSPEMVYMWARAVLLQLDRYRAAVKIWRDLEIADRRSWPPPQADDFFEAWCAEHADLHFLMEAATQMYRWASVPDVADPAWTKRRLLYDVPGAEDGAWIKTLRDALVHLDEAYRSEGARAARTQSRAKERQPDLAAIELAARYLAAQAQPEYPEPY